MIYHCRPWWRILLEAIAQGLVILCFVLAVAVVVYALFGFLL